MGQRYLPIYDENGDIVDPSFFVLGMSDIAGEFNGGLDRDNFAQADIVDADVDETDGRVFTDATPSYATDDDFVPDMENTSWQGGDANDTAGLGYVEWTAPQDAHVRFAWHGSWTWDGSYSWVTAGTRPNSTDTFDTVTVQMVLDGTTIAVGGPWEDGAVEWSGYICGAAQIPAGTHTLRIECEVVRRDANSGELMGVCTNQITFGPRGFMVLQRFR